MPARGQSLQIVREASDGSLHWQEPLAVPGTLGQSAVLADIDLATLFGATAFEITAAGDWLATVKGIQYHVLPAVMSGGAPGTFAFIGVEVRANKRPADTRHLKPKFASTGTLSALLSGDPSDVHPYFSGTGSLAAKLTRVRQYPRRTRFRSTGTLSAEVDKVGAPLPMFASEGELTARVRKIRQRTRKTRFVSAGRLTATVTVPGQIGAVLAGDGSLSAMVVPGAPPIEPPLPGGQPMSLFEFKENSGPITESTPKGYTLTAQDPATGWVGTSNGITGRFDGVVGYGRRDAWRLSFSVMVNPGGGGGAASAEVESGVTDDGRVACGVMFSGGAAYAQMYDDATGDWEYNLTTAVPPNASLEWTVTSDPATNTTKLRVGGQPAVTLNHATVRHFDTPATLLQDSVGLLTVASASYSGNITRRRKK